MVFPGTECVNEGSHSYDSRFSKSTMESEVSAHVKSVMLGSSRLRIDPNDGSSGVEYRIEQGAIERRSLGKRAQRTTATEAPWQQLAPEQVASHVLADSV